MVAPTPTESYLQEKALLKNGSANAKWTILIAPLVIISIVIELLYAYIIKPKHFGKAPKSEDVYAIAKQFIEPTLRSSHHVFSDTQYQFGTRRDSVYVIRSSVDTKTESGEDITTYFRIVLKYNGGQLDQKKNWTLMDITER